MTALAGHDVRELPTSILVDFLHHEAACLDDNDLSTWLTLLTSDIDYRVPIRVVRERGSSARGTDFSGRGHYLWEDYGTLSTRVLRLSSEFAWAETPPTRTRRFVANVRRVERDDLDPARETLLVNNLAVYCYRGDSPVPTILTGEREDVLRIIGGEPRLAVRLVRLDSSVLGLQSLSIFL